MEDKKTKNRILVVDDTPENIWILVEALKDEYAIMVAKNGYSCLRLAEGEHPPDAILLDVTMPGIDGYEVCRRLKANPATCNIPVLFITGQTDAGSEAKGLELGAMDYITKPFQPLLIKTRVRNQIELKKHRDQLELMVRARTEQLSITQEVTIEAMATLAEWRDPETGGHIKRTQRYVRTLAEHMATLPEYQRILSRNMIEMLYLSAPLHDVGKVSTPDAILFKPDRLTPEEFEQMKLHTVHGRDLLSAAERKLGEGSFLHIAHDIAYCHHERWDGKGYPRGIREEGIPLSARLMSVADVYDALASKRAYKPALPHEKVVEIIQGGKGTQFDPHVVDAFIAMRETFREITRHFQDEASLAGEGSPLSPQ